MHTTRGDRVGFLRPGALLSWVLVALLLTACGPFEDDEEPTATAETVAQPTSGGTEEAGAETPGATETAEATDEPSAEPTGAVTEEAAGAATPAMTEDQDEDSTPGIATPAFNLNDRSEDDATPAGEAAPDLSTPVEEGPGTESGPVPTAAAFTGSDGTSGATPISLPRNDGSVATPATGEGTPEGTPGLAVLEETRTSDTVDLTAIDPVSVDSCSPDNVPILIDGNASFVTNSSVNFRSGPGADCDAIGNGPLGAGIPVLVTSAPVDREGDEYVWVQITVNDIVGWVVIESLDPA